jgi:hypothetical protein
VVSPQDLATGAVLLAEADLVMSGDYCGGLWAAREGDIETLRRAADILMASPDLGLLLTNRPELVGEPGLLPEAILASDHPRSPDLRYVTRGDPQTGTTLVEPGAPIGGGVHGGLLRDELFCLCAWGGSLFKRQTVTDRPSGPADVAATILGILGFGPSILHSLDGRVLTECLAAGPPGDGAKTIQSVHRASRGDYRQMVERTIYQGRAYIEGGGREA